MKPDNTDSSQHAFGSESATEVSAASTHSSASASSETNTPDLFTLVAQKHIDDVCALLKLQAEDVDLETELSDYGFDSVTLTSFGNQLGADLGISILPTIFFEYPTIGDFAQYRLMSNTTQYKS